MGSAKFSQTEEDAPLRSELFSVAQMDQHGQILAQSHRISTSGTQDFLLPRLDENQRIIADACKLLNEAVLAGSQITPGAEWLLDNANFIEEQIHTARKHLPKKYSKELPRLSSGQNSGYPRVYEIALELVSHGDGDLDAENISHFLCAYQQVTALSLGELWAVPIMLRFALIENLRRISARLTAYRHNRNLAESWAQQFCEIADNNPANLVLLVADLARSNPPMVSSFVADLTRKLQGKNAALTLPLTWISQRLSESGMSIEQLISSETRQQAADQVSISNTIDSLHYIESTDWIAFIESTSVVDRILRSDPVGVYDKMDFATRDRYRHSLEKIAKSSIMHETEVAEKAIQLASLSAAEQGINNRRAHVGYYLIDDGKTALKRKVRVRLKLADRLQAFFRWCPLCLYLGSIALLMSVFTVLLLNDTAIIHLHGWMFVIITAASILASSHLAIALVNWLATLFTQPHVLPRMDYSAGIPNECRTLVAVPSLLYSAENVDHLCEALEVRFLANRDENLRFCLVSDFTDAQTETTASDEALLQQARRNINAMNAKYRRVAGDNFILLHRPRKWNPHEQAWIGHERKRGKLADLNAFLRNSNHDAFMLVVGNIEGLSDVKYVITLDSDTQLPRDAARQFVATIAHPLNNAQYDEKKQLVTEGYGLLQPRVSSSMASSSASIFEKLHGGEFGIDQYTRTVSDVYQDLFHEGSFIGKGIYDIDVFEQTLKGRFPDNRILSHDLIEGCHVRCALLSDAQLYEDYPATYGADARRHQRWIRGDWQLIPWLLPRVPDQRVAGKSIKNPLSALSQWKLLDNLRRSLVSSSLTLLFLLGWLRLPPDLTWNLLLLAIILIPPLCFSLRSLMQMRREIKLRQHLDIVVRVAARHFAQAMLKLTFLPYDAWFSLDAIVRANWRTLVSHKHTLEWNPSARVNGAADTNLHATILRMWFAPALALITALTLIAQQSASILPAMPILLLWLISPAVSWWVSCPKQSSMPAIDANQIRFLRRIARKTWAFFETHIGAEDNWLPPDNVQELPIARIAHRTSPTNIGLSLLANLAACDFGYITLNECIQRTRNTLLTMEKLDRYKGHFYNWYDTQTLQVLQNSSYISTVDSGNLAAHLLTLRPGLMSLIEKPIINAQTFEGIQATFSALMEHADFPMHHFQSEIESAIESPPASLSAAFTMLNRLSAVAAIICQLAEAATNPDAKIWSRALEKQCLQALEELIHLAPWAALPSLPNSFDSMPLLAGIPTLQELAGINSMLQPPLDALSSGTVHEDGDMQKQFIHKILQGSHNAMERETAIRRVAWQAGEFARMEYGFLYDSASNLLAIGYNVSERELDTSRFGLLASEARLSSFVAIAQGKLPQENWFALGRMMSDFDGEPVLLSWSGSMFEYLMPLLVMPNYQNTLLDQSIKSAVQRQIAYGNLRGIPWGVSESGYYAFDTQMNYQYQAFGIPSLRRQRGLGIDLVVSPHASMLALMVMPEEACSNLQRLAKEGLEGQFGFYEAIDYTPSRLPPGRPSAIVRSFMSHHQGMSLLSMLHLLHDSPMQKRFESDPLFKAILLLLQERPQHHAAHSFKTEGHTERTSSTSAESPTRVINSPSTPVPEVQLLSNGKYHVMLTNAGSGYSKWGELALTRWHEDTTCDQWGQYFYIRNLESGTFWSNSCQPTHSKSNHFEATFEEGVAEFRRRDKDFRTHTKIVVSSEDDIELRRVVISNRSLNARAIEVTSYMEVALAPSDADTAHPVFSKLFIQTEILHQHKAIICTRRSRAPEEISPFMFHMMTAKSAEIIDISYETDRLKFIGRGNTAASPRAMTASDELSDTDGTVIDPVLAIRYQIMLRPEETVCFDLFTGVAENRNSCMSLIEKYQDKRLSDRIFEMAGMHSRAILRQLTINASDARLYAQLAGSIMYVNPQTRAEKNILIKNHRSQSSLWGYGISGTLPIVLLGIKDAKNFDLVHQMLQAYAYWRRKGLVVDLVILNENRAVGQQELQEQIMRAVASSNMVASLERPGGIFVRMASQISNEDRILFATIARIVLSDTNGALSDQIKNHTPLKQHTPHLIPTKNYVPKPLPHALKNIDLKFFNGIGGFTQNGCEYVITLSNNKSTPMPWVNVLANARFGSVISESGSAYTWCENAREFRLTPWNNDPVSDNSGEAFYLRDEDTGHFWSPTPWPRPGRGEYRIRHGFGYSVFEHIEDDIHTELWVYVAVDDPVKYSVLKICNASGTKRRLSATAYVEWVLGDVRAKSQMHVVTEMCRGSGAIFARNAFSSEFPERIAFFDSDGASRTICCDRAEFIGRNGSLCRPAAMGHTRLSGFIGAGLDPCAAIQTAFHLEAGQEHEIVFMLGAAGRRSDEACQIAKRLQGKEAARNALQAVHQHWHQTLSTIQVNTPDESVNILVNGWLMYQTIACRMWARSGSYQSGGAFGFRDQLQDAMAMVHTKPLLVREHLLRCAARQFVEGDVQHWWHPSSGRGVRSRCSDDLLWLPLATSRYISVTGDVDVLNETILFIEGRPLHPEESSYYDVPAISTESASLYQHCVRAIEYATKVGEHGLPFIGSGDWNDGMDKVGERGKGESVWMGFFLYEVLMRFLETSMQIEDTVFAERCHIQAAQLQQKIEEHGWDGAWYRRAWFDDGTPLGSAENQECQIDSVTQSWSVLSGAGNPDRQHQAMQSLNDRLIKQDSQLVLLLDPPFDQSQPDPGYIKAYPPGIRENGAQYTHAAIWAAMAYARMGDKQRAWELTRMLNPINRTGTLAEIDTYKVEPYVMAADIYANPQHVGRGGWSWYTGSSGWMYRLLIESLLGLNRQGNSLTLNPCIQPDWDSFKLNYRYHNTTYHIEVKQTSGKSALIVDGVVQEDHAIKLIDDSYDHSVQIHLGSSK